MSAPVETVSTIACPQCGGENPLPAGERLLTCQWCDATLYVDRSAVVSHYRLPRLLGRAEAEQALRRWMAGNDTVKHLDRRAELAEAEPLLFPLWMFRARPAAAGGEIVVAQPAAPTPVPALADLKVPAGRLEPYRPAGDGSAATPTAPAEPAATEVAASVPLATARGWLGANAGAVTEIALVHVPLWRFVYRFAGQSYTALVEGSTGAVFASVFPAKSEAPYLLVAILGLVLFGIEGLVIAHLGWKLVVYALTAVPLFFVAFQVARRV